MASEYATLAAAREQDIPALIALQRAFYAEEGYPYDAERMGAALAALLRDPSVGRAWLVAWEGRLVGYLLLTYGYSVERGGRIALVDELFVRQEDRGRGLASLLLAAAEAASREGEMHALLLEVERANTGARRLYARLGFQAYARDVMAKAL